MRENVMSERKIYPCILKKGFYLWLKMLKDKVRGCRYNRYFLTIVSIVLTFIPFSQDLCMMCVKQKIHTNIRAPSSGREISAGPVAHFANVTKTLKY